MTTRYATLEKEIADALWTLGRDVESSSKGRWRWCVDDSGKAPVDVRLEDDWFTCQLAVPPPSSDEELWRLAERHAFLDGACRVIVEPRDNSFHIREDVPVTENGEFGGECRRALEIVISARRTYLKSNGDGGVRGIEEKNAQREREVSAQAGGTNEADPPAVPTPDAAAVKDACIEAGWRWSEREGSEPWVEIDVPQGSRKIGVETFSGKGCRLSVQLARFKSLSGTSRAAVAGFLLTANAFVRFARAGVEEMENGVEAFCEVWIDERPTPAIVGHALASLSVGCRLCEKELQVLGDENVARMFLDLRGPFVETKDRFPHERVPVRQG